ncbi:LysR family transcriptional regulator [Pseudomonas sp. Bc-h]|jgi:LysR family nitrogen assimilation transcriptional regulator|uniref:LysR family transcriptional regulator n=1 Tax=unclassified Pseudomonas TaxID=196821 RepID=UPI0009D9C509|nr:MULTISPECIES: LysR family transcriptional regulator [unclassified Pseudomonas]MDE1196094.1 LysR family transcriptional regulator [Pseudomonas sp.]OQR33739.1 LysR family transcriptional regulator [Pseudomonas sp. Bc-h]
MNSDDLALFAQVAKSGSISRAAMELGADQSTVSRRVGLLEAELGVRLFHRSGRGVTLTERGQQLLGFANTMNDTLVEAERAMRDSAEQGPAKLCIAAQPTIARILFGSLGHALKARYPLTQVHFVEGLAADILNRLSDGAVDIAILYLPEHPGALQFDPLLSEGVQLITPANYPLKGDAIAVRDLGDIPLILPSTHHGLRMMVESLANRYGFSANIALECDGSISITKRLVLENCGCTVLPAAAVVEEVKAGRLKSYRLEDPEIRRTVAIVWPKNRVTADGLWAVTQIIRQRAADMVEQGTWPGATLISAPVSP